MSTPDYIWERIKQLGEKSREASSEIGDLERRMAKVESEQASMGCFGVFLFLVMMMGVCGFLVLANKEHVRWLFEPEKQSVEEAP